MDMEKVYSGKTKDIYRKKNGNLCICFKDDVTGQDGVVDPGANQVMGRIKGKGRMSLELTAYFFKKLEGANIPTHLVSANVERNSMEVRQAVLPGQNDGKPGGLEFICRQMAFGSFLRRYKKYVREDMQKLGSLVEITLKDDERGDPLVNDDTIVELGILTRDRLNRAKDLTRRASAVIAKELESKGLSLVDIKMEFGMVDDDIVLIDEVSADSMRVMDRNLRVLSHQEVYMAILN